MEGIELDDLFSGTPDPDKADEELDLLGGMFKAFTDYQSLGEGRDIYLLLSCLINASTDSQSFLIKFGEAVSAADLMRQVGS